MFSLTLHESIDELPAASWNRLVDPDAPFMRHEFLAAMEHTGCVGEGFGWLPRHLALRDRAGELCAAAPCYIKLNSYGEFVFDWAWADAYRRHGLSYYPKLVVASPYTPATGPRILTGESARPDYAGALAQGARQAAERLGVSSIHWLFTTEQETDWLERGGLMRRMGCQFHWTNRGYAHFDHYLEDFTAEKRKKLKRERRRVGEAGIHIERVPGDAASEAQWATFHRLYCDTFDKKGGVPTLSLAFFHEIAATMGEQILLVFAYKGERIVAAAFNLVGAQSLFGRHWGCFEDYHSLHFETCYYQGLEHCIEQGLKRFEPGAQGEHKIARGFLPRRTWSAHWIADERFRAAIGHFLNDELQGMEGYVQEMHTHSPFKVRDQDH